MTNYTLNQLKALSLKALKVLADEYDVRPSGDRRAKATWVNALYSHFNPSTHIEQAETTSIDADRQHLENCYKLDMNINELNTVHPIEHLPKDYQTLANLEVETQTLRELDPYMDFFNDEQIVWVDAFMKLDKTDVDAVQVFCDSLFDYNLGIEEKTKGTLGLSKLWMNATRLKYTV